MTLTVDYHINPDGRVTIRRIQSGGRWFVVEQGRQWQDEDGRHVLVMFEDGQVDELLLSAASLRWERLPRRSGPQIV